MWSSEFLQQRPGSLSFKRFIFFGLLLYPFDHFFSHTVSLLISVTAIFNIVPFFSLACSFISAGHSVRLKILSSLTSFFLKKNKTAYKTANLIHSRDLPSGSPSPFQISRLGSCFQLWLLPVVRRKSCGNKRGSLMNQTSLAGPLWLGCVPGCVAVKWRLKEGNWYSLILKCSVVVGVWTSYEVTVKRIKIQRVSR